MLRDRSLVSLAFWVALFSGVLGASLRAAEPPRAAHDRDTPPGYYPPAPALRREAAAGCLPERRHAGGGRRPGAAVAGLGARRPAARRLPAGTGADGPCTVELPEGLLHIGPDARLRLDLVGRRIVQERGQLLLRIGRCPHGTWKAVA